MNNLIIIIGGHVIHSYGRLVQSHNVITRGDQLLPPDNETAPGRMDCITTAPETVRFELSGDKPPSNLVYIAQVGDQMATLIFKRSYLMNPANNVEGFCQGENCDTYFFVYSLTGNTYY